MTGSQLRTAEIDHRGGRRLVGSVDTTFGNGFSLHRTIGAVGPPANPAGASPSGTRAEKRWLCGLLWSMGRREILTVVPALVGLAVRVAQDVALDAQLLAVDEAPRQAPRGTGVVTAQEPSPGCYVCPGSRVRIWVTTDPEDGEGNGGRGGTRLPTGPVTVAPAGRK